MSEAVVSLVHIFTFDSRMSFSFFRGTSVSVRRAKIFPIAYPYPNDRVYQYVPHKAVAEVSKRGNL